jgi:hypothetical protein
LNEVISKHLRFCKATAAMLALLFRLVQEALDMLLREMELSRAFGDPQRGSLRSNKVVAADRNCRRGGYERNMGRDVPLGRVDTECLDKRPQDRQRQIVMRPIRRFVEPQRQMWLPRKRAKPFASFASYAPSADGDCRGQPHPFVKSSKIEHARDHGHLAQGVLASSTKMKIPAIRNPDQPGVPEM